jgi:hypothetical protein
LTTWAWAEERPKVKQQRAARRARRIFILSFLPFMYIQIDSPGLPPVSMPNGNARGERPRRDIHQIAIQKP